MTTEQPQGVAPEGTPEPVGDGQDDAMETPPDNTDEPSSSPEPTEPEVDTS